jgi:trimeric autotransporter adhesin
MARIPGISRMRRSGLWRFVQFMVALSLAFSRAAASEHRGVIQFNEFPVPGATVTATQGEKKLITTADLQGMYFFPDLTDGIWKIEVDMLGFRPTGREISIGQESSELVWHLTMRLLPEIETELMNPISSGAPVEFQRADVNRLSEVVDALPETGKAAPSPFANLNDEQLAERAADGFLVNGSVNNAAASPMAQTFAFGNNRRRIKSVYRGNFGLVIDNSAFNARPFSLTGQDTPKPDYDNSQISVTIGGPVKIPRLVRNGPNFLLGYQRIRGRNAMVQTSRMPTREEREGNLFEIQNPLGQPIQIFDPGTGEPFDKNVIPQDRISPQAKSLLALYPFPNTSDSGRYNYQVPIVAATHQDSIQGQLSQGLKIGYLSGRFNYQTIRTDNPNAFAFLDTGRDSSLDVAVNYFVNFNRLLSANLGYQFQRMTNRTTPYFADRINVSGEMGISGNNQEPANWGPPSLSFQNYERLTDAQNSFDRDQTNGVNASILINHRDHFFRIGTDFRRHQVNLLSQQDARGTFTFNGAATGYDFADFLLGIPDASSIAFGNADKYFRASRYAAYINDDWHLSSGLTLNVGVRWEYEAPMTELYGRLVNLDITPGFLKAAPITASDPTGALTDRHYPESLVNPDKSGIQPRIGFAWRPMVSSSMVIRGGYGIYRDTSVYRPIAMQMAQQSPFSKSMAVGNSPETPLTLANGFNVFPQDLMNTFAIDPGFRVAVVQNWQFSIQRDLPMSLQIAAMYLGAKGSHLIQRSLPNSYPEGAVNPCATCPSGFVYQGSNGTSIRHAGQIQLRRRLRNGLAAELRYVFSKSIDDAALGTSQGGGATIAQNWLDLRAERQLSNFDQRHLLTFQAQYTTGSGVFHSVLLNGWRGAILKEWTIAGQLMLGSGLPLTPVYPIALPGTGIVGIIRPSRTAAPIDEAPPGLFLNPAAYMPPPAGEWGDAGRNSIAGPNQFSLDVSLGRTFRLRDLFTFDFRLDGSNILNHVTFPSWNTTINSSQFGLPDRSNPMRKIRANLRVSF